MWIILLIGLLIVFLLWQEYRQHDCINGKKSLALAQYSAPSDIDTISQRLDKISDLVRVNYSFIRLNQALIVGLILALPICYFLVKRIPTLFEWIIMALLIAVGVYFSYSWIYAHFLYPNGRQIERNLLQIRDLYIAEESLRSGQNQSLRSGQKKTKIPK